MKTYSLILTQEAADEVEASYYFYEDKQPGLGERFKMQLDETLSLIQRNPEMFNVVKDDFREAEIRVFPFVVVFEIVGKEIRVYSVFHTSRNPRRRSRRTL
ncbi:MAG: type II toxin-antitoxin system RelE/ParE family toxin [Chitinophagales bacterium]|mgnify:CR=1 FL=1|nr:type II toxin-antitoxin system RelE/ParE family toxin [Chitinophagales bacterium]